MQQAQTSFDNTLVEHPYIHYVKYMGSKSKIMDFVLEGLNEVYTGGVICDLFAGSASLAGAIGHSTPIHSNDIQSYSSVLARNYLYTHSYNNQPTSDQILSIAQDIVTRNKKSIGLNIDYTSITSLDEFNEAEKVQQGLINRTFRRDWHLFVKYYSGTWWTTDQCIWIDAIRQVAEDYKDAPCYSLIISSLMFAMAYTSQGTGHYAQYRDAKTVSSMKDISIYRKRSFCKYFKRKYDDSCNSIPKQETKLDHKITSLDYTDCLDLLSGGTVYADPPYCFVHYSRFYHAMETLVLYDYPNIQVKGGEIVKGRYREERHQSPFSIKSQVAKSFSNLFSGIRKSESNLVLSYCNTGMITIDELNVILKKELPNRQTEILFTDHQHMTLGRQRDRHRDVKECLILVN